MDSLNTPETPVHETPALTQADLDQQLADISSAINTGWVLICAFLVFWEQAGFAMWEAGSLREKNIHNILLKNIADSCISGVAFYAIGYTIAFGETGNAFIGGGSAAFLSNDFSDYASFVFQWAFAATAATTVPPSPLPSQTPARRQSAILHKLS